MWVQSLGQEDPLEKEMTTHSSILDWRIPWTVEPGATAGIPAGVGRARKGETENRRTAESSRTI